MLNAREESHDKVKREIHLNGADDDYNAGNRASGIQRTSGIAEPADKVHGTHD